MNTQYFRARGGALIKKLGTASPPSLHCSVVCFVLASSPSAVAQQKDLSPPDATIPADVPQSSFQKVTLPDGALVELPKSWKFSTEFNQNMDETMEAFLSGIDPRKINANPAQNKTQLVAGGWAGTGKSSLSVIYIDRTTINQAALAAASPTEKAQFSLGLQQQVASAFGAATTIGIEKVGSYQAIITHAGERPGEKSLQIYQLPLGNRIVQFQFLCGSKQKPQWEIIWNKVVMSYKPRS